MSTPRAWHRFAFPYPEGWTYVEQDEFVARMYDDTRRPVPVFVTEDPNGEYLGWIDAGDDQVVMVQHERVFDIQFTYGAKAEVDRGRGAVVRVRIEATDDVKASRTGPHHDEAQRSDRRRARATDRQSDAP